MLRKITATIAATAMLGVAACTPAGLSAEISKIVTQVQSYTAQVCHVVPDVSAVIAIVNSATGDTVAQFGTAICAALGNPVGSRLGAAPLVKPLVVAPGTVNGIDVVTGARHI